MEKVDISIVTLVYNHAKYLRKCLDSLLMQKTQYSYEIIIHDDNSNDGSDDIIKEYSNKFPHIIKAIFQESNQYSKNVNISKTFIYPLINGRFVAFCEGDDCWIDENKLQMQADKMMSDNNISMCVHDVEKINSDGTPLEIYIKPNSLNCGEIEGDSLIRAYLQKKEAYPFQTSSYMIRKEILFKEYRFVNYFDVGDLPMLFVAALNGKLYYIPKTMSYYRINVAGSYNERIKNREYSIKQLNNSILAFKEFNIETNEKFKIDVKKIILYWSAQLYFASGIKDYKKQAEYKKALTKKEYYIAKYKYTKLGNFIRNVKNKIKRMLI